MKRLGGGGLPEMGGTFGCRQGRAGQGPLLPPCSRSWGDCLDHISWEMVWFRELCGDWITTGDIGRDLEEF